MVSSVRDQSLLRRIENTAHANPGKVAISCAVVGDVTYSRFLASSRQLVSTLRQRGVPEGHRVAVFMRRSAAVVIAMHAVLTTRCTYVPIYHGTPRDRLYKMLSDCEPAAIICDAHTAVVLQDALSKLDANIEIINCDPESLISTENPGYEEIDTDWVSPDSNFSILYTSGSTGVPKGVISTHGNLKHYIDWSIEYFQVTRDDIVFCTAPFHFDMSAFDIYVSLATGAELVVASEKDCLFPKVLMRRLASKKVTVWKAVSSLLSNVANSIDLTRIDLPDLNTLIFAGERLPTQHLMTWMSALPAISYFNGYGPTEATGVSCCHRVYDPTSADEVLPIGRGRIENEVMIFDGQERIEVPGRVGELIVTGPGVAKGYWRDVEKTAKAFVNKIGDHVFESVAYRTGDMGCYDERGDIVFLARMDRQIKHQGYRIELDDIESVLHSMPGILDAAAIYLAEGKSPGLAAFYVATDPVDEASVRVFLASQLPAYMVPKLISHVSDLPRNDRGKIDYPSLMESGS